MPVAERIPTGQLHRTRFRAHGETRRPAALPAAGAGIEQHLAAIRDSHERIRRGDESAVTAYNYSVSRLVETIEISGYPYPYSASLLRRELDHVNRDFPDHKNMVIIGHSMGSMISRLMVTDVGEKLWIKAFGHPPSETKFTGHSRQVLLDSLVFSDRKEIDRAVFYSGPHRGSILATNWVGRIASRLVKMPGLVADVRNAALSVATGDIAGLAMQSAPNSIGTLSPTNPFVVEINKIPIVPRIPYHSIMGDRGKGDTPDSSDGVVAYWSSHLDGAVSNKIVPSSHGSHAHPEGIAEARRILLLHLKSR